MNKPRTIIHSVREIGPGGGVSGVAHALNESFKKAGLQSESYTLKNLGIHRAGPAAQGLLRKKIRQLFEVVYYSTVGSLVGRFRSQGDVVISHNDGVFGQIYVNHGLHKALISESSHPLLLISRNPIHAFLLVREWLRFTLRVHKRFVCFAQSEADLMMKYYPQTRGKIAIIPNGVNTGRFQPDAQMRAGARREWGFSEEHFVLSFVGHEYERKGLYPLVKALKSLPDSVRLLVAGGTPNEIARGEAAASEAGVRERIVFLGVYRQVERVLNASDAFLLPSRFEAWPLVGLEAMSCGVPALMKPTGGIPDFLKDGVNGFFITQEPDNIASRIEKLLNNRALRASMSTAARTTALNYSWESVAQKYIQLINSLEGTASAPATALSYKRSEV